MKSKTKILLSLLLASNMIVSCHNATPSESTSDKESPLSSTPSEQESPSIESSDKQEDLTSVIAESISQLQNYVQADDYLSEQKTELENIINEYMSKLTSATSNEQISSLLAEAKGKIDLLKTREQINQEIAAALKSAKESAIAEISGYADLSLYAAAEKAEIEKIISDAVTSINALDKIDNIESIVTTTKGKIDDIKTNEELVQEALAKAKTEAVNVLSNYVDLSLYNDPEKEVINGIIAQYTTSINAATVFDGISGMLAEAKGKIDEVKTTEELLTNTVTIVETEGGTITTDIQSAKAGEIVTISCREVEGYHIVNSSLAVVGKVTNTRYPVNNYKFEMPTEDVTITAHFSNKVELKPLRLVQNTDLSKNLLGWESVTASGWDQWPGEANKIGCHVEGFGYVNNLTIHGSETGEQGFVYNIENLNYDYFSAEIGVWHDVSCVSWATMNVIVRFLVGDSNEWTNETKQLIYAMKNPELLTVKIPENAKKMQLMIDPGVRENENTARPQDHDIMVWGNPMLHNESIARNVNSLPLSLISPVKATTGYGPIPAVSYGIRSYPGYGFLPVIKGVQYRDGLITHGTGEAGNDTGFTYDLTDYCVDGGFDTLIGKVGLVQDTDLGGKAELIIKVDDQVRFSKVMTVNDAAVPVKVDICGAKKLELLVSHADNAMANDCVAFCDMSLLKGSAIPANDAIALESLPYTSTTFWDGVPGQIYTNATATYSTGLLPVCNGKEYDSVFATHTSTVDGNAWYGFSFDVSEFAATTLVGKCGILDISNNRIGGTFVNKSMDFKVVVDIDGDGVCEKTVFAKSVHQLDGTADIVADITGAKKIELLMSCGADLTDSHGDVGIFTGMYIKK